MMELREIRFKDDTSTKVRFFSTKNKSDFTLICLPAMGVRASYYELFASQLCEMGFNVVVTDLRGHGESSVKASRSVDFGYEDFIIDLKETIEHINQWFSSSKKLIVGHSLGGQIGVLFASRYPKEVDGLILITCCSVHYKGWSPWAVCKILFASTFFYPLSKVIGYFPGDKIGFGGREARSVIRDWSYNGLNGEYRLINSSFDYEKAIKQLKKSVITFSIEKDKLANKRPVSNFIQQFHSEALKKHVHLTSKEMGVSFLNHFNWAKKPNHLVNLMDQWIIEKSDYN